MYLDLDAKNTVQRPLHDKGEHKGALQDNTTARDDPRDAGAAEAALAFGSAADRPRDIVVMIKWGVGYPVRDFNRAYRALRDTSGDAFDIVCVTDDAAGLDPGIRVVDLPAIPLPREKWTAGMWPKLALFRAGLFPPGARVLYIDVDLASGGDVAGFFDLARPEAVWIVRDWPTYHERWWPGLFGRTRLGNSSVLVFVAGMQTALWTAFEADPEGQFARHYNDQNYISALCRDVRYLPDGWCESFKKSTAPLPPLSYILGCRTGPLCKLVAFHGRPGLDDLSLRNRSYLGLLLEGYGRVDWIEAYLDRYDPQPN